MTNRKLSYCAEQVRENDSDRFLTVLFAPSGVRNALFALYAFNLEIAKIHESAREPMLADIRFQWWRDAITQIYAGQPTRHPVVQALQESVQDHALPRAFLEDLLDARTRNIAVDRPQTYEDLVQYSQSINAPLISMALALLGAEEGAFHGAVSNAATAWGLTELLRALPRHLRARRNFLPVEMMAMFDVVAQDIGELRPSPEVSNLIRRICEDVENRAIEARRDFASAGRQFLSPMLLAPLSQQYKRVFGRAGFDPFHSGFTEKPALRGWNLAYRSMIGRL
ncbi:MAG: squalene/phytoene synthase family protein [Alphaproteobacteria bacterium]|nr:squalene/phytoene synthase family protein [Alphaproteobacteria bacterium]